MSGMACTQSVGKKSQIGSAGLALSETPRVAGVVSRGEVYRAPDGPDIGSSGVAFEFTRLWELDEMYR